MPNIKETVDVPADEDAAKCSVAVLLTCHNRVEKTVACLRALYHQDRSMDKIQVYLVDDGSSDGTTEKIKKEFPSAILIQGTGNLFWNGGMHLAFSTAMHEDHDYYLWLNDDTILRHNALKLLFDVVKSKGNEGGGSPCIVVASTQDPKTGIHSYGGYNIISRINPIKLRLVPESDVAQQCDTFCGNCVLIPRKIVSSIGGLDPTYRHRWGDVDYGFRAKQAGYTSWVAPGVIAECEANPNEDRWKCPGRSMKERFREINGLKGLGGKDWWVFVRRFGGVLWPLIFIKPYLSILYTTLYRENRP